MRYLSEEQSKKNTRDYRPVPLLIEAQVFEQKPQEGHINIMDGVKKSKKPKYNPALSINMMAENLQHANLIKGDIKKNRQIRTAYLTEYEKLYDDLMGKKQREIDDAQLQRSGDLYAEMLQAQEVYEAVREAEPIRINQARIDGQLRRRDRERGEKKERKTMGDEDRDVGYGEL